MKEKKTSLTKIRKYLTETKHLSNQEMEEPTIYFSVLYMQKVLLIN